MTTTPGARVPSMVGDHLDARHLASEILRLTGEQDGATLSTHGQQYTGDGILVALPAFGATLIMVPAADLMIDAIADWVAGVGHVVTATASPRRYIGAWYGPDARLYLDVVEAFSSADEDAAVAAGRARNQIAVWHNGRGEQILTGGTGAL